MRPCARFQHMSSLVYVQTSTYITSGVKNKYTQCRCSTQNTASPKIGVATALFRKQQHSVQVLLVQRGKSPNKGLWSLPGGGLEKDENALDGALRELNEETQISSKEVEIIPNPVTTVNIPLPGSISWKLLIFAGKHTGNTKPVASDDAANAAFHNIDSIQSLPIVKNLQVTVNRALEAMKQTLHTQNYEETH